MTSQVPEELKEIYMWRWNHRFPLKPLEKQSEFEAIQSFNKGYDFVIDGDSKELVLDKQL